jgi:hypothetical protein
MLEAVDLAIGFSTALCGLCLILSVWLPCRPLIVHLSLVTMAVQPRSGHR